MTVTLKIDGIAGKCAIWTGGGTGPYSDPLTHVPNVQFHSDLLYPAIINTQSGSTTLPAASSGFRSVAHTLFAHGRSGYPYVEGKITSGLGVVVALAGSIPVQQGSAAVGSNFYGRWVALGADASNVILHEYCFAGAGFGAITIGWTVYITDVLL